ncbi:MAG: methyl-accepting chemotaxis protein [Methylophilaceae bacterium]
MLNLINVSIKDQLRLMTIVLLGLMIAVGAYGIIQFREANVYIHSMYQDRVIALKTLKMVSDVYNVDLVKTISKVRNKRLSAIDAVPILEESKKSVHDGWKGYMATWMDDHERNMAKETEALINQGDANYDRIIALLRMQDEEALANYVATDFYPFVDPIGAHIKQLMLLQQDEAKKTMDEAEADYNRTLEFTIALIIVAILLGLYLGQVIISGISKPLTFINQAMGRIAEGDLTGAVTVRGTNEIGQILKSTQTMQQKLSALIGDINTSVYGVFDSSAHLAVASNQVATSSNVQAEATSSVAAAIEELTTSIEQSSANASSAESRANQSRDMATKGANEVQMAADEMSQIAESVNQTAGQMAILGQEAQKIGSIVDTIKDVADQTNLLALNAAIEAARAGEQGRGFAVVADEVRKLAERTAKSAQEITAMVQTIQEYSSKASMSMEQGNVRVSEGVARANKAGQSMREINDSSATVMSAVGDISSALVEQRTASMDIARNVERIAQMTEENSAAVAEVSSAASSLEMLANNLKQTVARFKV